jgi:hypothetical protein
MKAFSVNAMTYKDARLKTKEYRLWHAQFQKELEPYAKKFNDINKAWNNGGAHLELRIEVVYPENIFYTKAGHVSAKTFDVSNIEKPIQDLVVRHAAGIDDRFVTKLVSTKRAGLHHEINIELELYANGDK